MSTDFAGPFVGAEQAHSRRIGCANVIVDLMAPLEPFFSPKFQGGKRAVRGQPPFAIFGMISVFHVESQALCFDHVF
jgi:hypothetical protein